MTTTTTESKTPTRLYRVTSPTRTRLIKATSPAQAARFAVGSDYAAQVATQMDLVDLLGQDVKVEDATKTPTAAGTE